jgi:cephalosporin-C deacetylase-like acetyl esterase
MADRLKGFREVMVVALMALALGAAADRQMIRIECEDLAGPWRFQTNIPGYLGRGFRTSNANGPSTEPLTGTFSIEKPGRYWVWARAYEGNGSDRRWKIAIDDIELSTTHAAKGGERFSWQRAGEVELEAGEHQVRAIDVGDGYETADSILVTDDPEYDPGAEELALTAYGGDPQAHRIPLDYIVRRTHELEAARHTPKTLAEWKSERAKILPQLLKALGLDPLPARTPLNLKTHSVLQKDGYRVELLTYEARPGEIVTANVYVPEGIKTGERRPAVICPAGHWGLSKCQPEVQSRAIGLAKLGFVAMTYDPIGQGERAVDGNGHDESLRELPTGHMNLSYMVWDTMRGIDYLISRPDVDPQLIGCTGCSGGGLNTIYAAAIDDRIACSAPVAFYFDFEEFLSWDMWHCACNHIPGLLRFAGMREVAGLAAPRPQMLIFAIRDEIFPIKGARSTYQEVRKIYDLYGASDRIGTCESDSGHGYNQEMREGMYGFFVKHLMTKGDGSPIPEPALDLEPEPFTRLLIYGGKNVPAESETFFSFAQAAAKEQIAALPGPEIGAEDPAGLRGRLGRTLAVPEKLQSSGRVIREADTDGMHAIVAVTQSGDGVEVTAVFFPAPGDGAHPLLIYVREGDSAVNVSRTIAPAAHASGMGLLWVDCRGWGETSHAEGIIARDGVFLGEPILGQRVRDVLGAMTYFAARPEVDAAKIAVYGSGLSGSLVALYAAALDDRIAGVAVDASPASYLDIYDVKSVGLTHIMAVPSILDVADIAQTVALIAPRKVWLGLAEGSSAERLGAWREYLTASGATITEGARVSQADVVKSLAEGLQH